MRGMAKRLVHEAHAARLSQWLHEWGCNSAIKGLPAFSLYAASTCVKHQRVIAALETNVDVFKIQVHGTMS